MIAFDTSALVKLVIAEAESGALRTWLSSRGEAPWTASELCRVEVIRAAVRSQPTAGVAARLLLDGIELVPLSSPVLERAAMQAPPALRSLDAIHLATATLVAPVLEAFVVYDVRLADAATAAGLPVVAPA